jgi:hypothetical protein
MMTPYMSNMYASDQHNQIKEKNAFGREKIPAHFVMKSEEGGFLYYYQSMRKI